MKGPVPGSGRKARPRGYPTDLRALLIAAREQGATVTLAHGSGHIEVEYQGRRVQLASTPSDRRSLLNSRARLRRMGLRLP